MKKLLAFFVLFLLGSQLTAQAEVFTDTTEKAAPEDKDKTKQVEEDHSAGVVKRLKVLELSPGAKRMLSEYCEIHDKSSNRREFKQMLDLYKRQLGANPKMNNYYYGTGSFELSSESGNQAQTDLEMMKKRAELRVDGKEPNFTRLYDLMGPSKPEESLNILKSITTQDSRFYNGNKAAANLDTYDDILGRAYYELLSKLDAKASAAETYKAYKKMHFAMKAFERALAGYSGADSPKNSKENFNLDEKQKQNILNWYKIKTKVLTNELRSCIPIFEEDDMKKNSGV